MREVRRRYGRRRRATPEASYAERSPSPAQPAHHVPQVGRQDGEGVPAFVLPLEEGLDEPLPLGQDHEVDLLVLADEPTSANCSEGQRYIWMFDVREPSNPVSIATFPQPAEADYCAKGGSFGPHNLHENRPGAFQSSRLIFATYYNAGVRAYDIENPYQPREVGYYVPPDPTHMMDPRPNRPKVIQSCDCYVDRNGLAPRDEQVDVARVADADDPGRKLHRPSLRMV